MLSVTDPASETTTNTYDNTGLLMGTNYSNSATPDVSRSYNAAGALVGMTDGSGSQSWEYDSLGRMLSHENGESEIVE